MLFEENLSTNRKPGDSLLMDLTILMGFLHLHKFPRISYGSIIVSESV